MGLLEETLIKIQPVDRLLEENIQLRLDRLTKPRGSLGRLEELALRYGMAVGEGLPRIRKKVVYTFAGDHGVTAEGVSAYPREVTPQMVYNFLQGGAGVNVLARHVGAEVRVVDVGVDHDFGDLVGLHNRKVARGTRNMVHEPAMTREEALRAVEVGITLAKGAAREGVDLLGTGEMGIGNTTPSSAIVAVMTGEPVDRVTGRGTGIDEETHLRKVRVIASALNRHNPDPNDPLDILAKVGGLEIGGIAGLILGGAAHRIPVVLDGFIAWAGALLAAGWCSSVRDYLFASHLSVEEGHRAALERLSLKPLLDLDLRLGEGTGACLGIGLVEAGVRILTEMATFDEAGVSERIVPSPLGGEC
ncbi:MAG: nicotinate-nucleotide--dimethylbenzimidazole phosphoribosyltransferase [Nitrospirae bacterium]|nr:nicotinate-nucleotide--dimethylbenzimidazole phosphoribosyltransferase [Nitrospirota bacterium]